MGTALLSCCASGVVEGYTQISPSCTCNNTAVFHCPHFRPISHQYIQDSTLHCCLDARINISAWNMLALICWHLKGGNNVVANQALIIVPSLFQLPSDIQCTATMQAELPREAGGSVLTAQG